MLSILILRRNPRTDAPQQYISPRAAIFLHDYQCKSSASDSQTKRVCSTDTISPSSYMRMPGEETEQRAAR